MATWTCKSCHVCKKLIVRESDAVVGRHYRHKSCSPSAQPVAARRNDENYDDDVTAGEMLRVGDYSRAY